MINDIIVLLLGNSPYNNISWSFTRFSSYYEKFADGKVVCIDDEIPFEIPDAWEWCRLGFVFSHCSGKALNGNDKGGAPYQYITTSNLYWNRFELDNLRTMNFKDSELEKCTATKGDLLVCEGGDVGRAAIWYYDFDIKIQNHIHKMRAFYPICTKYFYYILFLYKNIGYIGGKGIGIQGLSSGALDKILFPIASLQLQERIVEKIDNILPAVERYNNVQVELDVLNNEIYGSLKKSILQEAIQGKLVPQDPNDEPASVLLEKIRAEKAMLVREGKLKKKDLVESTIFRGDDNKYYEQIGENLIDITGDIPFDIPSNWVWTRIGYLFAHNNGKQLNKGNSVGTLMEYITTSNLYWDGFRLDNLKIMPFEESEIERCQAIKGDLLVCEGGDVGRSCIWTYDYPIMLQNHIHKLRAYLPLCTKYFFYIFYLYNLIGLIGGKGIGIQGFSAKALHNTIIPVPPLNEQERIVKKIEIVFDRIKGN